MSQVNKELIQCMINDCEALLHQIQETQTLSTLKRRLSNYPYLFNPPNNCKRTVLLLSRTTMNPPL